MCYCYTIIILQPNVGIQRLELQTRVFVLHVDARFLHVVDLRSWCDADEVYTMQLVVLQLLPNDERASVVVQLHLPHMHRALTLEVFDDLMVGHHVNVCLQHLTLTTHVV